jgi:hypothetical protein
MYPHIISLEILFQLNLRYMNITADFLALINMFQF